MKNKLLLFCLSISILSIFGASLVLAEEEEVFMYSNDVVPIEISVEFTEEGSYYVTWDEPAESDIFYFDLVRSTTNSLPESDDENSEIILTGLDERGHYDHDSISSGVVYYRMCVFTILQTKNCGDTVAVDMRTGLVLNPFFEPFTDIEGHWAETYIEKLRFLNVVQGRGEGLFEPNENILRAEAIKIFMLAFGIGGISCHSEYFPDLEPTHWFCDVVSKARQEEYVIGDNGFLYPEREITRAEAVKVVLEIKGVTIPEIEEDPFDDVDHTQWYAKYIAKAKDLNIVQGVGDNNFEPNRSITRAELSKIAVEAAEL